jgi:hypothetical protein
MRMWSRGLGRQNIGISLSETTVMTLDEALEFMLKEARDPLLEELDSQKVVALSGKMLPPTGWEFVITLGFKDLFSVAWNLVSWKTVKSLFLSPVQKELFRTNDTVKSATNRT